MPKGEGEGEGGGKSRWREHRGDSGHLSEVIIKGSAERGGGALIVGSGARKRAVRANS